MEAESRYDGTLEGFFALLDRLWGAALPEERWPRRVVRPAGCSGGFPDGEGSLFDPPAQPPQPGPLPDPLGGAVPQDGAAGILFRVSADAYDALVRVWMSGRPLEGEALRYALRVLSAAKRAASGPVPNPAPGQAGGAAWYCREEARRGAAVAARDRLDDDCRAVLALSGKVAHEIDRLTGFLRFSPDGRGRYVARCSPDYAILPALGPHFSGRFGDAPWAVIDQKRGLALAGVGGGDARLFAGRGPRPSEAGPPGVGPPETGQSEAWEELWRCYHRVISIESRKNPSLQRGFIPLRYRGYLDEFKTPPAPPAGGGSPGSGGL
ncbi:MAG: DUF4130 domain-containing protein [Treponema sp.]|jgi:hypothetical protein|nr:DUF4130 domain-containing protein [Treponema sp.]